MQSFFKAVLSRLQYLASFQYAVTTLVIGVVVSLIVLLSHSLGLGTARFPARELRTDADAPALRLTDQTGQLVDLQALQGKVVLLTAVYTTCPHTCPQIMAEAKRVVGAVPPHKRADLRVIAVTLDPKHDTPEELARFAEMHHLATPPWHLVTGGVPDVERTLDAMGIARARSMKSVIDHGNLLMLIDRRGRLAYRMTMGPKQEPWLRAALKQLLAEPGPA